MLALTTRTWHDDLLQIDEESWVESGTPESSSVIPWSVETLDHDDVEHWQGSLEDELLTRAVSELTGYVTALEP